MFDSALKVFLNDVYAGCGDNGLQGVEALVAVLGGSKEGDVLDAGRGQGLAEVNDVLGRGAEGLHADEDDLLILGGIRRRDAVALALKLGGYGISELLRNAEKFMDAFAAADYALSGGDDGLGAASQLKNAENALHSVRALGARFSELCKRLESLYSDVYDLAETVRDLRSEMDFSPQELDAVESRADQLYRLKKKYGATVGEMLDYLERSKKELDEIEYADDRIVQLQGTLAKQEKEMLAAARTLSDARKAAAKALEERILRELRELDMNKVRFSIDFTEHEPDATGIDTVRFLMSANAGEDLKPIHKIASGGELARIMLALKNVLAEQDHVMTMVFDEVDTGVSGRAAQRVAEKMAKLSRRRQVLCVTHLPQLAAMADTHFSVEKGEENGRTFTRVVELDRAQRCAELARLTGGAAATETQLRGAEELLSAADAFRSAL